MNSREPREKQPSDFTHRQAALAYSRGYAAARYNRWPATKPPLPPEPIIRGFLEAAIALRDAAETGCATFSPNDEFVVAMRPGIDAMDKQIEVLERWLANRKVGE